MTPSTASSAQTAVSRAIPGTTPSAAIDSAIDIHEVRKVFGSGKEAFTALDGVALSIRTNEFFTLLGPSGCGKTTLLRLIAGFEFPTAGQIRLHGTDIAGDPPYRRPINTVFQNYALFPHMSVERNVAFGLEMLGKPRAEIDARVAEVLALVQMSALAKRATSEISGGQQQRVALARALAPSPEVLLLDEPLSALDYQLRKEMQIELKRMQGETGITFVFVTHDQEEALTMSDRIAVMSAGKILQVGTPHEIYEQPANRFVASFIGETNFLECRVEDVATATGSAVVTLATGQALLAECDPLKPPSGRCTIVIRPEHVRLHTAVPEGALGPLGCDAVYLPASLTNIVYSGTDTQYLLQLEDGSPFMVRHQNTRVAEFPDTRTGDTVQLELQPSVARVMGDGS